ncbi:MAG: hypothetical protein GX684_01585 [Ruminococcaceae bacterium]|nr:hypothetical protein [Oscillospiraceae bacterium]
MQRKVIKNTATGALKKLFSKDRITGLAIADHGFSVIMEKSSAIEILFENLSAAKVSFFFDALTPYRTLTLITHAGKEYTLNIDPYSGELEDVLQHFANYQLPGGIPENINDIDISLLPYAKLRGGKLLVENKGSITEYPWDELEYYRIDKPSETINLKFKNKKLFVTFSAVNVTNLWLFLQILGRHAKEQKQYI